MAKLGPCVLTAREQSFDRIGQARVWLLPAALSTRPRRSGRLGRARSRHYEPHQVIELQRKLGRLLMELDFYWLRSNLAVRFWTLLPNEGIRPEPKPSRMERPDSMATLLSGLLCD